MIAERGTTLSFVVEDLKGARKTSTTITLYKVAL
jgi:hypothetical protein